jgi:hypothetical protein
LTLQPIVIPRAWRPSIATESHSNTGTRIAYAAALLADFFGSGTLAPFFLASDRPMAMACFGLVTFFPLWPDFNLPAFISRISVSTDFDAAGLYFLFVRLLIFAVAISGTLLQLGRATLG